MPVCFVAAMHALARTCSIKDCSRVFATAVALFPRERPCVLSLTRLSSPLCGDGHCLYLQLTLLPAYRPVAAATASPTLQLPT
ncbi:hypothetical protein BD311DRAFT_754081 [Dichomitus squalens]|uniref:Uncharacterized protein n=1 Tax=Dichomitus squalens TaxID=114155 RepID=A0A4Q9MVX0_9APHY|nr:hypothetical protein BD311DRAFT_754081 [Dichomitus squalens]